jgi:protein kinase-like protein
LDASSASSPKGPKGPSGRGSFQPGSVLGGRYQVAALHAKSPFGDVFRATDNQTGQTVAVRRIRPELLGGGGVDRLKAELERAAGLEHKNLVRMLGVYSGESGLALVTQWVEGASLRAIIARKNGEPAFSLKGAYNVIAHLCNALTEVRKRTFHGAITPSSVLINQAGRVRLAELALPRAFPGALAAAEVVDRPCIAPEMLRTPAAADGRADLYSLAVILFELVTGKMYMPGMLPRKVVPALPQDLDALAACLLSSRVDDRLADPQAVKHTLQKIVDKAAAAPPPAPRETAGVAGPGGPQKVVVDDTEYRWLVTKGKLDYGPFTLAQIRDQIAKDEVVPGNILIDTELGKRAPVEEHPLLREAVLAAAQRRDDARRASVETHVVKQEAQKGLALYAFIGVGALVLVGGSFLAFKLMGASKAAVHHDTEKLAEADLAGLKLTRAKHVDDREAQRRHRAQGRAGGPAGSRGAGDGFDDSLSFDMASPDVGDERLDDSQINGVLARHTAQLGRCLSQELSHGGAHQADIEFIVLGSGKVSAVRVNGQTGTGLATCIRGTMQAMAFPSFNGPRTRASFSMSL